VWKDEGKERRRVRSWYLFNGRKVSEKYQSQAHIQVHWPLNVTSRHSHCYACDEGMLSGFRREVAENCAVLGYVASSGKKLPLLAACSNNPEDRSSE
jgi:hypothetical protein